MIKENDSETFFNIQAVLNFKVNNAILNLLKYLTLTAKFTSTMG